MIPYFVTPISGNQDCALRALKGAHGLVSFYAPTQLEIVRQFCQSFCIDNGAYSAWRSGKPITDWQPYYDFVKSNLCPNLDFVIIPDIIEGTEKENDLLVSKFPFPNHISVPVWHMHESLDRLTTLSLNYPRIAIGGSCQYKLVGSLIWWERINQAFERICVDGIPICKVHGLRMLGPEIFTKLPLSSADSSTLARNIGIDKNWGGRFQPLTKETRATVLRERIEFYQAAERWEKVPIQDILL